jgi:alpha-tubulin suppressor-like RCC1 family protein
MSLMVKRAWVLPIALALATPAMVLPSGHVQASGGSTAGPTALAWGGNSNGQVGSAPSPYILHNVPVAVGGLTHVVAVAGGQAHSVALEADGTVWGWGADKSGQLGNGSTTDTPNPVQATGLSKVSAIAAGGNFTLALRSDGTVWGWGDDANGQVGPAGTQPSTRAPVQVTGLSGVLAIAAGDQYSLAVRSDGAVWTWGATPCVGSSAPARVPFPSISGITAVAAGTGHVLARRSDGTVWAWGDNAYGDLGNGASSSDCSTEVQSTGLANVVAVAAGVYHSVALKADGTVLAWGMNIYGQAGAASGSTCLGQACTLTPTPVSGLPSVSSIAAGGYHNFALTSAGVAWGWGRNDSGQLGNASTSNSNTPVQVSLGPGVSAVAAGVYHSLAVPAPPTAPRNLSAAACNDQVTLHWQSPASAGSMPLAGYNVYRGTASGTETVLAQLNNVTTYRDTALTRGTTYYYAVSAYSAGAEGPTTPEVTTVATAAVGSCPVVQGVSPDAAAIGSTVTVLGQGFDASTTVLFGSVAATPTSIDASGTSLKVVVPSQSSPPPGDTVDVVASNASGPSRISQSDEFAYGAAVVTSVSPLGGPLAVRTRVTLTGSDFVPGSTVRAGSVPVPATDVTIVSPTTVVALLPASSTPGTVDVVVANPLGSFPQSTDRFTYGPPVVDSINPDKGASSGGQQITIAVHNFVNDGTTVSLGGRPATVVSYDPNYGILTVRSPSNPTTTTATVPLIVGSVGGTSNGVPYTYWAPPTVTSVTPPVAEVTCTSPPVTIRGSNFDAWYTFVYFGPPLPDGSNESAQWSVLDQNTILAYPPCRPSMAVPATVDVIVISTGGQSASNANDRILLL